MNFLEKLEMLMKEKNLNKSSLSQSSDIPYTTIDGWFKKGYANAKLPTMQKLADYFDVSLDYLVNEQIDNRFYGKTSGFDFDFLEMEHIKKYRILDKRGKEMVDTVLDVEYKRALEALGQIEHVDPDSIPRKHIRDGKIYYDVAALGGGVTQEGGLTEEEDNAAKIAAFTLLSENNIDTE